MRPEKAFILSRSVLTTLLVVHLLIFVSALDNNLANQQHSHNVAIHRQHQKQGHVTNMQVPQDEEEEEDEEVEFQKYIPSSERRTLAEELRAARQAERARAAKIKKVQEEQITSPYEGKHVNVDQERTETPKKAQSKTIGNTSKGIRKGISAVRSAGRQVRSSMHHYFDHDDEDEYEYIDEDGEVISDSDGWQESAPAAATRVRRRRKVHPSKSFIAQAMAVIPHIFKSSFAIALWMSRNVVWTPMTYVAGAVNWSAQTSWQTTTWAGERAFVGPARTISAPFVYLIEGLLFIFIWIPARVIKVVVRELYPVYVFLGAALAIGTAMGIAAAVILYVGSFIFGDQSKLESSLYERGDRLPRDMEQYVAKNYRTGEKRGSGKRKKRTGSIIEDAIRESLQREERQRAANRDAPHEDEVEEDFANEHDQFGFERAWKPKEPVDDSDEDDDYFGTNIGTSTFKGNARSPAAQQSNKKASYPIPSIITSSNNSIPSNSAYAKSVPVGATGQGGWGQRSDSNSSTPISSPAYTRSNMASPFAYTSSRTSPGVTSSPSSRVGPDSIRSHHSRQRRNVQATSPVA